MESSAAVQPSHANCNDDVVMHRRSSLPSDDLKNKVVVVKQSTTFDENITGVVVRDNGKIGSERVLGVQFDKDGYEAGIVAVSLKYNKIEVVKEQDLKPIGFRCVHVPCAASRMPPHLLPCVCRRMPDGPGQYIQMWGDDVGSRAFRDILIKVSIAAPRPHARERPLRHCSSCTLPAGVGGQARQRHVLAPPRKR